MNAREVTVSPEELLTQIAHHPNLPSPPAVALKVLETAGRPDCRMSDIAQIISHDPGLCANLLKIVNSALYTIPRTITSLNMALNMLGLSRVRALVLSLSLPAMQRRKGATPQTQNFWKASVAGAVAARELSVYLRRPDPETDMVTGLLRDVGSLILYELFPEKYGKLQEVPPADFVQKQCELETKMFGVHHAEVSAHILKHWRLPPEFTEPIFFHHFPGLATQKGAQIQAQALVLYFAHLVGQLQVMPDVPCLVQAIVDLGKARFQLVDQRLHKFLKPLQAKIEQVAQLLAVDIGKCHDYEAILSNSSTMLTEIVVETSVENLRMQEERNQADEDRRKAESALRDSEAQVRHAVKMEAVGRLAGGIAHDFNNLLTVINGYSDILLSTASQDATSRQFVQQIRMAGERAATLTKQLLAFSRKQVMRPVPLDLNAGIANLHAMMSRVLGERIEVEQKLAPGLPPVFADPGQIDQVLINLLLNARDAMPKGGKIVIETAVAKPEQVEAIEELRSGSYVLLTLSDNGCGMDDETKAHVFEPFFTTKEPGKGTGLGLAMVYGIVKQSGGHIALESTKGVGTAFRIYLPKSDDAVQSAPARPAPALTSGETILVVEDDEAVRGVIRQLLQSIGYKVLEASDSETAMSAAAQHSGKIDLLLTDVIMPVTDGYELSKKIQESRPETKVCYISGYVDDKVIPQGVLDADVVFLPKPFAPNVLASRVREILRGSQRGTPLKPTLAQVKTDAVVMA
jgi:signal transduction histidine kinase/ActR/RegA family two-component response regulator